VDAEVSHLEKAMKLDPAYEEPLVFYAYLMVKQGKTC
jgi:hypothetical protein